MIRFPAALLLTCLCALPAQAEIFNLDDEGDTLWVPPRTQEKAKSIPSPKKESPSTPANKPAEQMPTPAPVPAAPTSPVKTSPAADIPAPITPAGRILLAQFPLYRDAHAAFLKGDHKSAFVGFSRLLALAKKQRAEWEGESPFAVAAYLRREECRLTAGDAKDKAKALANLRKFCESDPVGLCRGEAFMLLAKARLDANDCAGAWPWLVQMKKWVSVAREIPKDAAWVDFPADLRRQIEPAASPWLEDPDYFGNPQRRPMEAAWLVNERTAAWRMDELEASWAKTMGFAAMARDDMAQAKACWSRFGEVEKSILPPQILNAMEKGEGKIASEASRLEFVARNGRMLAYPGEEKLLNPWPNVKLRVLYAEFLYLTSDFDSAERELREVLAADDAVKAVMERRKKEFAEAMKKNRGGAFIPKFRIEGLPDAARDYVQATLGTVLNRKGDNEGAMQCFEAVFSTISHNMTERRCVLAYASLVNLSGTADQRKQAAQMEDALLASTVHDQFSCLARFWRVLRLEDEGKKKEALALLDWYVPGDGPFHEFARRRLEQAKSR